MGNSSAYSANYIQQYFQDATLGKIPGVRTVEVVGNNPDIQTGGFEVIADAGGVYVGPTIARIHDIASTDVADAGTVLSSGTATGGSITDIDDSGATFITDGVAPGDILLNDTNTELSFITAVPSETKITVGRRMREPERGTVGAANKFGDDYRVVTNASTGTSLVFIEGLSQAFVRQFEFVVMNGVTNVPTTLAYLRQYTLRAIGGGSAATVGDITSIAQTDLTTSAKLMGVNNQSLMAVYTVPADENACLYDWWGSLSKKQSATSTLKLLGGSVSAGRMKFTEQKRSISNDGSSEFNYTPAFPAVFPPSSDIWVEADTDFNSTGVSSGFNLILTKI